MKTFEDIVNHEGPISLLQRITTSGRPVQALLLDGPEGTGKRLTALVTGAGYLCNHPDASGPCGQCDSCRRIQVGSHGGFWLIDPNLSVSDRDEEEPEPVEGILPGLFEDETGSDTIGISPVRSLREELALKPSGDPRRAIVLADFNRATKEAQNALLKTLEEPPEKTLIICTASGLSGVENTVVSRCQRIRFQPLSPADTRTVLEQQTDLPDEEIDFLAGFSDGCPGQALQFAGQNVFEEREWFLENVRNYGSPSDPRFRKSILDWLSSDRYTGKKRQTLRRLLKMISYFLQDALYRTLNLKQSTRLRFPEDDLDTFLQERSLNDVIESLERIEQLNRASEQYVNNKILVENLSF